VLKPVFIEKKNIFFVVFIAAHLHSTAVAVREREDEAVECDETQSSWIWVEKKKSERFVCTTTADAAAVSQPPIVSD
jgi:hypothetical protein